MKYTYNCQDCRNSIETVKKFRLILVEEKIGGIRYEPLRFWQCPICNFLNPIRKDTYQIDHKQAEEKKGEE
jgi:hypothetical protein